MGLKGPQTSEVIESFLPFDAQTLTQPCLQWSSGLCLNTSVMGNARSGQAALPITTPLRPLESSSSLNKPPCGPHPQPQFSRLVPQEGTSPLAQESPSCVQGRVNTYLLPSSTRPVLSAVLCDTVCSLFPIMASFLSPPTHPRLSNKSHTIEVQG